MEENKKSSSKVFKDRLENLQSGIEDLKKIAKDMELDISSNNKSTIKNNEQSTNSIDEDKNLVGFAGWLIPIGIFLIIESLVLIFMFSYNFNVDTLILLFYIYTIYLYFNKKKLFKHFYILKIIMDVIIIAYVGFEMETMLRAEGIEFDYRKFHDRLGLLFLAKVILIAYMQTSKRVKNTFIN
tara:strand:- start:210 stop:758 length:549 start_codon:yes stop_codon:yes gene_type:complete